MAEISLTIAGTCKVEDGEPSNYVQPTHCFTKVANLS